MTESTQNFAECLFELTMSLTPEATIEQRNLCQLCCSELAAAFSLFETSCTLPAQLAGMSPAAIADKLIQMGAALPADTQKMAAALFESSPFLIITDQQKLTLKSLYAQQLDTVRRLNQLAISRPTDASILQACEEPQGWLDQYLPAAEFTACQRAAAQSALTGKLTLVSGGAGTGKTTTMVRIAAMFMQLTGQTQSVALAAFTGRAALRLGLAAEMNRDHSPESHGVSLYRQCFTLHRLLGLNTPSAPAELQAVKLLIVDEASMIDAAIFQQLLIQLPTDCHLILVGDENQLPPINLGRPFSELVSASEAQNLPSEDLQKSALGRHIKLTRPFRFQARSELGQLADEILHEPAKALDRLLNSPSDESEANIRWLPLPDVENNSPQHRQAHRHLLHILSHHWRTERFATDPEQALDQLQNMRILCRRETGPLGYKNINRDITLALGQAGALDLPADATNTTNTTNTSTTPNSTQLPWMAHCPILIQENDRILDLRNGEMGIVLDTPEGLRAFFKSQNTLQVFALWELPAHSLGWAISIHRSQGSEYDRAAVIVPTLDDHPSSACAELYTAITRARKQVLVVATANNLERLLLESRPTYSDLTPLLTAVPTTPTSIPS
ncbi:MAG: ATP-dependent DNA helicase [Gammaproteobacteria bacterium]